MGKQKKKISESIYLDLDNGYLSTYTQENASSYILRVAHFIVCTAI